MPAMIPYARLMLCNTVVAASITGAANCTGMPAEENYCAVGNRILTHVTGTDAERRLAIDRIAKNLDLAAPDCHCADVPSWIEWPTEYSKAAGDLVGRIQHVQASRSNGGTFQESPASLSLQRNVRAPLDWHDIVARRYPRLAAFEFAGNEEAMAATDRGNLPPSTSWNHALRDAIGATFVHVRPDPKVRVAVVDTGVASHPFLPSLTCAGQVDGKACRAFGRKVVAQSDIQYTISEDACYGQHATWVAGAIAGTRDGVDLGMFPGVPIDSWSAARTCNCGAMDTFCTSGLQWLATLVAAAKDARVVNLSYETNCEEPAASLTRDAFARLRDKNVVLVSGTPNRSQSLDGTCVQKLGEEFRNVLFVAPLGYGNAPDAAFGAASVMLGVPFATLNNTMCTTTYLPIGRTGCPAPGIDYGFDVAGNASMATAVVSAAAAMVRSDPRYSSCNAEEVVEILLKQATPQAKLKGGVLSLKFLEDDARLVEVACAKSPPATVEDVASRH